jgi:hypothetical protein
MLRLGMWRTRVPLHTPPTLKRPTAVASMMSLPSLSLTARVTSIRVPTSGALLPGCSTYSASPRFLEPPAQGVVWQRRVWQGLLGASGLHGLCGVACLAWVGWHGVVAACALACRTAVRAQGWQRQTPVKVRLAECCSNVRACMCVVLLMVSAGRKAAGCSSCKALPCLVSHADAACSPGRYRWPNLQGLSPLKTVSNMCT